ncbi:hypothetical protein NLJ89_g4274 [Agrocybe chaxingu]|uniref:Uncharacterized protein n=1 Tax=Agrocybe chaxingu TaxID=84603 RepID=A0A9W8K4A9_9AGAR|nr:hypothetical protein NLJ89_g4274 [Agrocybe chaxingu]
MYTTETPKHDLTSSFNALDDLIVANTTWDAVVQDAVAFLENEERNLLHVSTGPSSPSPIRVALHSSLQTTHTQCDNIRHLFSALTSPAELSQLSEMYAPPSPVRTGFTPEGLSRPLSYPLRSPTSPARTPESKRSTWNGSYSSLAYAGSPTNPMYRRRDKHRVNLSDVFETKSAPVTPLLDPPATRLSEVPEDQPISSASTSFSPSPMASNFGSAALEIQRKRKSGGMDFLRSPPPASYSLPELRSPRRFSSTITSSSKFTNPQPARHPLSYSALTYSLQGTLSAKRYTCSHLLALRFSEEDDEGYWEDVRSVMGLLTSALMDASSRLAEALDEVEHQKLRDQNPTPSRTDFVDGDVDPMESVERDSPPKRQSRISFAPLPSHISRFGAHVAAIGAALDDARENLEQCVAAIKEGPASSAPTPSRNLRHSRSFSRMLSSPNANELEQEEHEALQAYERLRRELGLALRECERGRERLLEIVKPAVASDDEEEFDDVPGLAHDASASDDSDKPDPTSPAWEDEAVVAAVADANQLATPDVEKAFVDDANPHLLRTTSAQHLPLPGIEEVFEADTGAKVAFARERSKLRSAGGG